MTSQSPVVGEFVHYVGDDDSRCRAALVTEVGQYVTVTRLVTVPKSFDRSEGRPIREVQAEEWWYADACALLVPPTNEVSKGCKHDEREWTPGTWHRLHQPEMVKAPR